MATWLSNGADVGGSGSYVAGTQSVQYIHDTFAGTGDIIQLPNGTFTWSTGASLTKSVTLQSQNFQQATIQPGNIGANSYALSIKKSTGIAFTQNSRNASIRVTGINFAATTATQVFKHVAITELSGAKSVGSASQYQLSTYSALVDNCTFLMGSTLAGTTQCGAIDAIGNGMVIAWCTFTNTNTGNGTGGGTLGFDTGGIECHDPGGGALDPSWQSFDSMGTNDTNGYLNIYVENCTFNGLLDQALDHGDNSRVVWRYNTLNDSAITSHGQDSGPSGGRHIEVYNNTWNHHTSGAIPYSPGNNYPISLSYWYLHRAATGIFTNNVIPDNSTSEWGTKNSLTYGVFNVNTGPNLVPCQGNYPTAFLYPAARQVGQTWIGTVSGFTPHAYATSGTTAIDGPTSTQLGNGQGYYTDPFYIWNNSGGTDWSTLHLIDQTSTVGSPCSTFCSWINNHGGSACGGNYSPSLVSNYITSGTDVVYGAKTSGPTGGWTAYTYPHPLDPGQTGGPVSPSFSGIISVTGSVTPTLLGGTVTSALTAASDATITRTVVGATGGYSPPTNNWAALFSTQFGLAKAGAVEWSGGNYARQPMGTSGTGWTIAAYSSGVGVVWKNTNLVYFPAVLSLQTLFSLGFCDALSAGNIDFFIDIANSISVPAGINVTLPALTGAVFTTY